MKLVLIEGPGKREAVQKYLGQDYRVVPTFGHVRDLPEKKLGVDIANNFKPEYTVLPDKQKTVDKLKADAKKAEKIFFATDPDREGEAIAWHLSNILNIDPASSCRIAYNEISKIAVNDAIKKPRPIDLNLVDAQQARRVLDRLVGYKLSPLLCKKIQNKLSAGRVQSVTLKLVVDRDREIENFKPVEYWTLAAELSKNNQKEKFKAILSLPKNKKVGTKTEMDKIISDVESGKFQVKDVKKSVVSSHAAPPFTTSSLQQEASSKLGMNLKTVSSVAQGLYEGVDVQGEGKIALVTYIRTDSVRVSPDAMKNAKVYISEKYGEKFVPEKPNFYKSKKDAQDAHEAIRPISLNRTPESLKGKITPQHLKLYKLIFERFVASQMSDAKYNQMQVDIDANGHAFKCSGKALIFEGFTAVYGAVVEKDEGADDTGEVAKLPPLEKGDVLGLLKLLPEQKYTKPPVRYTDGTLVKAMEEKGIGRPATYAQTVTVLLTREYVTKDGKFLISSDLGRKVVDMLCKYFSDIMDVKFTAEMETKLDDIEDGGKNWQKIVGDFYIGFEKELKSALGDSYTTKIADELTDIICEKCGSKMVIKTGRFGKFLACPNFPKCKNTKQINENGDPVPPNADGLLANKTAEPTEESHEICEKCGAKMVVKTGRYGKFLACSNYPTCKNTKQIEQIAFKCPKCGSDVVKKLTKTGKVFYGCSKYPTCDFSTWDTPTEDKCPKCGEILLFKNFKGKKEYHCLKCDYLKPVDVKQNEDKK